MFVLFIICASFSHFLCCSFSHSPWLISLCFNFNCKFIFGGLFLWNFHLAWDKPSFFRGQTFFLTTYVQHLISCCLFCPFFCFILLVFCYVCYVLFTFESTQIQFSACGSLKHRSCVNLNSKPMWSRILSGDIFAHFLPTESNRQNK